MMSAPADFTVLVLGGGASGIGCGQKAQGSRRERALA